MVFSYKKNMFKQVITMGHLTPKDFEYDLLRDYVVEALSLLGQECLISVVKESINDLGRDK